ncbi:MULTISPECIES: DUF6328 family protein [unclassified Embleya]|uniref:DUF6328 family protein n=1 Tax=unclassified Embleya TaxID=2699296 RepID=UPI0033D473CE
MSERDGRGESADERADRRWIELLQEVRVVQTGAQVLFGFLLSVVFTPKFDTLGDFDNGLYVAAVVLGAASMGVLVSVVSLHRAVTGQHRKPRLVRVANHLVPAGVGLLACTIGCSLLLLLRVATDDVTAALLTAAAAVWFLGWWLVLPLVLRRGGAAE